jgi:hypothetical protein
MCELWRGHRNLIVENCRGRLLLIKSGMGAFNRVLPLLSRRVFSGSRQLQVGHTVDLVAKYPRVRSPDKTESVSMKKPCSESMK